MIQKVTKYVIKNVIKGYKNVYNNSIQINVLISFFIYIVQNAFPIVNRLKHVGSKQLANVFACSLHSNAKLVCNFGREKGYCNVFSRRWPESLSQKGYDFVKLLG
jgi:hypothetical protein